MSAYCLFDNVEVTHPDRLEEYTRSVRAVVDSFGGRYLAVGGEIVHVEGEPALTFPVLIEFPDLTTANRWYASPAYQPLKELRLSGVRANAVFFETTESALLTA